MKFNQSLILTGFILLSFHASFSQAICGFDIMHNKKIKEDASYRRNIQAGEASIHEYIRQHPLLGSPWTLAPASSKPVISSGSPAPITLSGPPYQIPVVVQVIHTGGAVGTTYNPTDAQIQGAIDYLNAVYNGSYSGMDGTNGAGDLQIQFVLAQRDPNCNPSSGINRIDGSGIPGYASGGVNSQTTLGADESNVKALSDWDHNQYYNIWIVDKIDGKDGTTAGQFIAGYAYFPGAAANLDGIVMLATQMVTGQKTLPHEIGHAFNLYHPFEGSTDVSVCPANTDCSMQGDRVCDTDPISENINSGTGVIDFSCRTGLTNTCTGSLYTVKTESNYMNYTNCFTLFTAGQKARMLAAAAMPYRSGLTTSMGGLPPSAGGTGCSPQVNFELTGDLETETSAASTGCRWYKDYSYNMTIARPPSAAATATLNVSSGNAKQGLDFDLTTNGNFSSPSQQLSFPAGATASQPFTIRVYDDSSVNGTRNVNLGFTVNAGGGDAVVGTGTPHFNMVINDNDLAPTGGTPLGTAMVGIIQVGLNGVPFDGQQSSQRAQFMYRASELTAAGIPAGALRSISFRVNSKHSIRSFTNIHIRLGTTIVNYLFDGTTVTQGTGMTDVKSIASYNTVAGWNTFTFDTPYTWDGSSNLVVEFCYDNTTAAPSDGLDQMVYYQESPASSNSNVLVQNAINCSQPFTSYGIVSNAAKPTIQLGYGTPATLIQTTLNASCQQYLGPNADLYFYDQVNGQLMARIQNLSAFNYGCTQVVIDRAGTNASQFWNTNIPNYLMDKTFHVLPTTNNPSGSYTITLYYTKTETDGWQAFTGQSLSAIQLVKLPMQILNVTAANPTGGGIVTQVTPTISALGTNTGLTYNFTNGFSGFGAGVPGLSTLPIGLLNFDGRLDGDNAVLNWTTAFEEGNRGFEVDRSFDGNSFAKIGFVTGRGNSTSPQQYSFTDPALAQDNNYYRLQQIDLDGKLNFSKVVLVSKDGNAGNRSFTVLPNPFSDNLEILFGQAPAGKVQIRLLDLTGRELLRQSGSVSHGGRLPIDLSGTSLSAGVYLLEACFDNRTQIEKLIKK